MVQWQRVVDKVLEAPVVTSFTRVGYDVRSRVAHWTPLTDYDLRGRTVLITGATSGLGRSAAETLARAGATVIVWGRDADKTERVRQGLAMASGNEHVESVVADMGDLAAVRAGAETVLARHTRLDALIHNAGALTADRRTAPGGTELTVASQVVGPFLLTTLLLPILRAASPGRVLTMASGGMYATGLTVRHLEMGDDYKGAEQYARAKRAQVTLNELWAQKVDPAEVVFHAVHPGWADTPGVEASLPMFRKVMRPLLRSPEQGADTLVWLTADDGEPAHTTGAFWLDRQRRGLHKLPTTRRTDTPERRAELWDWCVNTAGAQP